MKPQTKPDDPEIKSLLEKAWEFSNKRNYAGAVQCLNGVLDLAPEKGLSEDAGFQVETLISHCTAHEIDTALGQTVLGKFHLLHDQAPQAAPHFKRALELSIESAKKKEKLSLHPGEFRLNYARAMMSVILSGAAEVPDDQLEDTDEIFLDVTEEQLEDIESSLLTARECGLPGNRINVYTMMFYEATGREDKFREYAQRIINDLDDSKTNKEIAKIFLLRMDQSHEDKPEPPTQRYN